jgi:hypothetical protein
MEDFVGLWTDCESTDTKTSIEQVGNLAIHKNLSEFRTKPVYVFCCIWISSTQRCCEENCSQFLAPFSTYSKVCSRALCGPTYPLDMLCSTCYCRKI